MAILEGIIYKVFEQYVVLRGFAPIGDLASISEKIDSYQRDTIVSHKKEIINFLKNGEYKYFPEVILAARANNYTEFLSDVGSDDDISPRSSKYVEGLFISKTDYIPIRGHRARHANYRVEKIKIKRVDGNHRLELFDEISVSDNCWSEFSEDDKKVISEIIIPYCIIFTNNEIADKFEAGIFNNINFKQLPLKQEKNIQNIQKYLKETQELGYAHSLTMKLIDLAETGHFKGLEHLNPKGNDNDLYRTACYKIAKLLIEKKNKNKEYSETELEKEINVITENIRMLEQSMEQLNNEQNNEQIKLDGMKRKKDHKENYIKQIKTFLDNAENIDAIEIAIQSLRTIYAKMNKNFGNLSLLAAFVYYKLLDESKFNSFVDWVLKNGINKIPVNDELPAHNANSLIDLFERIYEAKEKEIFISMEFGDTQSELIYEKVRQTIEKFNRNKGLDISITPIRIDRTIEPYAFSIPDEILRAIENSCLIIADLSTGNKNVYHEVGYAMGVAQSNNLSPNIILLYKEDTNHNTAGTDKDKFVGFNLRNLSQLRFKDYKQLEDGLLERLEKHYEV